MLIVNYLACVDKGQTLNTKACISVRVRYVPFKQYNRTIQLYNRPPISPHQHRTYLNDVSAKH